MLEQLVVCTTNSAHRYHPRFDACPHCVRLDAILAQCEAVKAALVDQTIDHVEITASQWGSEPQDFALVLADGSHVAFSFWAQYADASGLDVEVNGERVLGNGFGS